MFKNPKLVVLSGLALIFLIVQAYYITKFAAPENQQYLAAISVVIFSAPTYWAVKMWLGWRDGLILIAVLIIYVTLIQYIANINSFSLTNIGLFNQFGFLRFVYDLWIEALAWPPLLLAAYSVSRNLTSNRIQRTMLTALLLFLIGLTTTTFTNSIFLAFILLVIFEIADRSIKPLLPAPVQMTIGAILITSFVTVYEAFAGTMIPVLVGAAIFVGLIVFYRKYYYAFDEMIVLVDDDNNAIGTVRKSEVHDNDTKLHRAFSVFLFNSKGEFLLQQRAFSKKTWPGVWSNSCCGHTMLHESSEAAGIRRVGYELGLKNTKMTMALPDFRYRAEKDGVVENEICPVLIGFTDEKPEPNPDEVANIKWVDWEEFLLSLKDPETEISPWAIEEVELLAESEIFKNLYYKNSSNSVD